MIDRTCATSLNETSWAYANERFNARKGDYARAVREPAYCGEPCC